MNRYLIIFVLIVFAGCVSKKEETQSLHSISYILQTQSPYQNGKMHGTEFKEDVRFQIKNWEEGITSFLKIDRDSIHNIVYKHTGFLNAIKQHTPELIEEMNGIADGAELDRDLVLYFNLGEEIYNFCLANFESCSNIAFQGKNENALAYNQDLPDFLHGKHRPVILDHKDHYVFTMPGNIALSGVSQNLGVSCNSLPMLKMNTQGLPLPFFIRKLLQSGSMKEAQQFIERTPLAIPQNLMLISDKEVRNAEISKNQIKWVAPQSGGFYYHTNFPIENTDFKASDYTPNVCRRFEFLDSKKTQLMLKSDLNIAASLEDICAQPPIENQETYLRFITVFKENTPPTIKFINPETQESILLKF